MTTTQTKLLIAGISLAVAVGGFFTLHMSEAKGTDVASLRAEQAILEQKIIDLKPSHEAKEKVRKQAEDELRAIEEEADGYRSQIAEKEASVQAMLNSEAKK